VKFPGPNDKAASGSEVVITTAGNDSTAKALPLNSLTPSSKGENENGATPLPSVHTVSAHKEEVATAPESAAIAAAVDATEGPPQDCAEISTEAVVAETTMDVVVEAVTEPVVEAPTEATVAPMDVVCASENDGSGAAEAENDATKGESSAEDSKGSGTKRKAPSGRPAGTSGLDDDAHVEALAKLVAQGEVLSGDKIVEAFLALVPGPSKAAVHRALREMAVPPVGRAKWHLKRETCEKFHLPFEEPPAAAQAPAGAAGKNKCKVEKKKKPTAMEEATNDDESSANVPFKRGDFVEVLFEESWYPGVVDTTVPNGLKIAFYQDQGASVAVVSLHELSERVRPSENRSAAGNALIGAKVQLHLGCFFSLYTHFIGVSHLAFLLTFVLPFPLFS